MRERRIKTVNGSLVPIDEFVLGSAVEVALRNGWGYDSMVGTGLRVVLGLGICIGP